MFFYRIEDKNGNGIYRSKNIEGLDLSVGILAAKLCSNCWHHTPPDIDFWEEFPLMGEKPNTDYKFAFKNLHQLYRWFDTVESIGLFDKLGFQISKYEIDQKHVKISESQMIYLSGKEQFIEKIPFSLDNLDRKCNYENLKKEQLKLVYQLGI